MELYQIDVLTPDSKTTTNMWLTPREHRTIECLVECINGAARGTDQPTMTISKAAI